MTPDLETAEQEFRAWVRENYECRVSELTATIDDIERAALGLVKAAKLQGSIAGTAIGHDQERNMAIHLAQEAGEALVPEAAALLSAHVHEAFR
jgi:hypothetical protein